ncbi:MAG: LamB/YcsF family protein [Granulosicoccus sp.]|nr:LamB/YcsF family protein [Granulosicoccus sp.]
MLLNLNADLGESFGPWPMGDDARLLNVVNSANIACGFHAGDPLVMSTTIDASKRAGVSIGAHPGFPDLQGFGRRSMVLPDGELRAMIQYQLAALDGLGRCAGLPMTHVKPHGALNNMACEDRHLADVIVAAVKHYDPDLIFLAPALSQLAAAAEDSSLPLALEVFADRAYTASGSLVSRLKPGAVLETASACITHVQAMIDADGIVTQSGEILPTPFHSICVHGDTAHAVDTARQIRAALLNQGHQLLGLPVLMARRSS